MDGSLLLTAGLEAGHKVILGKGCNSFVDLTESSALPMSWPGHRPTARLQSKHEVLRDSKNYETRITKKAVEAVPAANR